jgi:hypothetical protein
MADSTLGEGFDLASLFSWHNRKEGSRTVEANRM